MAGAVRASQGQERVDHVRQRVPGVRVWRHQPGRLLCPPRTYCPRWRRGESVNALPAILITAVPLAVRRRRPRHYGVPVILEEHGPVWPARWVFDCGRWTCPLLYPRPAVACSPGTCGLCCVLRQVTQDAEAGDAVTSQLKKVVRPTYSNPPIHGARIVKTVLADPQLEAQWYVCLHAHTAHT